MSKIAILIPTYKPAWYLRRCFEAIDNQTLTKDKYRVYIALNGPAGAFEEHIYTYLENFSFDYKFFYLENAGVSNARNFLIDNSSEDYIVFVDDDDVISENYLSELLSVTTNEFMGICNVKNFEHSIEHTKPNYICQAYNHLGTIESSKLKSRKYFSSPCAKMLHREMIGNYRFNEKLAHGEDALFMATISINIKAVQKAALEACYYVYERPNSASRKKPKRLDELNRVLYLTFQYMQLFIQPRYNKLFIATRVAATFKYLKRVF